MQDCVVLSRKFLKNTDNVQKRIALDRRTILTFIRIVSDSDALSNLALDNINNSWLCQGTKVAKLIALAIHDLAHDAAHDLNKR